MKTFKDIGLLLASLTVIALYPASVVFAVRGRIDVAIYLLLLAAYVRWSLMESR